MSSTVELPLLISKSPRSLSNIPWSDGARMRIDSAKARGCAPPRANTAPGADTKS